MSKNPKTSMKGDRVWQNSKNGSKTNECGILQKRCCGEEEERKKKKKRDKDREAETPGTDRRGCGESSLISQHHLLPVPGLKKLHLCQTSHNHTPVEHRRAARAPIASPSSVPCTFFFLSPPATVTHPLASSTAALTHTFSRDKWSRLPFSGSEWV